MRAFRSVDQDGFGVIQALILTIIVGLLTLSALYLFQNMNRTVSVSKSQTGRDSLAGFLMPVLSEQSLCLTRIQTAKFDPNALNGPGGNPATAYMDLSFLQSDATLPAVGATATFFPQFNLTVNSVYYANAQLQKPELVGAFAGFNVYRGEVWVSVSGPPPTDGGPAVRLADRKIASNFYMWVQPGTNKIGTCGILKTAQQACVDDLGGVWTSTPLPGAPNCGSIPYPCPQGSYYLGNVGGVPQCVLSPASPSCGFQQTVVSDGAGGTVCASIP